MSHDADGGFAWSAQVRSAASADGCGVCRHRGVEFAEAIGNRALVEAGELLFRRPLERIDELLGLGIAMF
jgi:hypothetical protein